MHAAYNINYCMIYRIERQLSLLGTSMWVQDEHTLSVQPHHPQRRGIIQAAFKDHARKQSECACVDEGQCDRQRLSRVAWVCAAAIAPSSTTVSELEGRRQGCRRVRRTYLLPHLPQPKRQLTGAADKVVIEPGLRAVRGAVPV